jgi:hypothetical protein
LFICITKNIQKEHRENDVVGTKVFAFVFFAKVFGKINFRFCEKFLSKVRNFHKNLILAVLEPLRFGSNQMRLSAAPALPYNTKHKSRHHRF